MARYSFSNNENWQFSFQLDETVQYLNADQTRYTRLPPLIPGFLLDSNVVAIRVSSRTSPPHHRFGGLVSQLLSTGLEDGGNVDAESNERKKIWLDRTTVIEWDNLTDTYGLRFDIPYWIQQITIDIFEYVGPINPA